MSHSDAIQYPKSLSGPLAARPVCDDVSVVIPTLGRPILETCLYYLAEGTRWPAKVIVVDQGREPRAARMLQRLEEIGIRTLYVPSDQRGRSAGINRGLERVTTRLVAITDDDCFVDPEWLERLADRLRSDPKTIWTGRVESAGDHAAFSVVLSREPQRHTRPRFRVHPFVGGNVGMAMDLVARIGPFDEHPCLASAEDGDYGYRALRLGIPIAYDPGILLFHYHWRDAAQRAARYGDYARSIGGFYGTHLRRGDPLMMAQSLRALVRAPVRWMRGVLKGDAEMALNGRESTRNLLPGIIAGLRRGDR